MILRLHTSCFLVTLSLLSYTPTSAQDDLDLVEVIVPSGPMKGAKVYDDEGDFSHFRFLGIPYAQAPVDNLRFRDPVPMGTWEGTLNATEFGAVCPRVCYTNIVIIIITNNKPTAITTSHKTNTFKTFFR